MNGKGPAAPFVPTAHTAKIDPAILAEAARVLDAKRARAALTGAPSSHPSLQQQPLQQQPSPPRPALPLSSNPQPEAPVPVAIQPKPPPIGPQPTLRSKVDEPAPPPPEPELVPAPAVAVEPEAAVVAAAPAVSGRALRIIAGVLVIALGAVLGTLFASTRPPASPLSAAPTSSSPTKVAPWPSSHSRALPSGAPAAPPPP